MFQTTQAIKEKLYHTESEEGKPPQNMMQSKTI